MRDMSKERQKTEEVLGAPIFQLTLDLGSKSEVKVQNIGAFLYGTFNAKTMAPLNSPLNFVPEYQL